MTGNDPHAYKRHSGVDLYAQKMYVKHEIYMKHERFAKFDLSFSTEKWAGMCWANILANQIQRAWLELIHQGVLTLKGFIT